MPGEHVQAGLGPAPALAPARISRRAWERLGSMGIGVALLAGAEWLARSGLISPLLFPPPSAVWRALVGGFGSGLYVENILSTLAATGMGFLAAAVIAVTFAGLLASIPLLERLLVPFIVAFQSMPKIAIAPLVVLWFGFGLFGKVAIVTMAAFFPIMVNSLTGLKIRSRDHLELMRSLSATKWQMLRYLRIQSALPYIFAGLHVGAIFALIGSVVAEFVGSDAGLGYLMLQAKAQFDVPSVFACLVLLMLIGIGLHAIMGAIENRVAFWARAATHGI